MAERSGPTVLVVDDSEVALEFVRRALEGTYHVLTRNKSAGAVSAILQERPELVLLDVNMPGVSGDTIASILRRTNAEGQTMVLLHSSLPAEALRLKVQQTGAHGFIQKASSPMELLRQVNQWMKKALGERRSREARALSDPSRAQSDPARPPSDRARTWTDPARSSADPARAPESWRDVDGSSSRALPSSGTLRTNLPLALFVDDDIATLASYRRNMSSEEVTCEFAESSEHALGRILSVRPPDVVVCDILMPALSGPELFERAVLADPSWRHRFVFVTGAASVAYVADFLENTAARVLHKPIDPERLKQEIRYCTAGARVFAGAR